MRESTMNTTVARVLRVLGALGALWLLLPVSLADFSAGLDAYNRGEWELAASELKPIADSGDDRAQFLIGTLYASGEGVEASMAEALRYYRLAAEQDNGEAQAALAFTYRVGNGVQQSYDEAVKWYREAADRSIGDAQFNLGSLYAAGKGVPKSYVQAYKWFSLAAAHGVEEAVVALFFSMENLSEDQIAEALRLATEWKPKE